MPRRFIEIAKDNDLEPMSMLLAFIAVLWGGWFLLPFDSMTLGKQFGFLTGIAPEWVWGTAMLGVGVTRIAAITTGHALAKRITAVAAFAWWLFIATTFAFSNPRATGIPILSLYALAELYAALRD